MCSRSSGMKLEAQLSDPMKWDTSLYDKTVWKDIQHARVIISRALIIGREALPDPGVFKAPETGCPELVLVQILIRLT